jgi:membrane protein YqaA with SNARE-associated domain
MSDPEQEVIQKPNWLRRMYNWTIGWAEKPRATGALAGLSFIESSFFPIPPDPLLMAICFAHPKRWFWAAFWCTAASVLGGVLGYYIGYALWETVGQPIVAFYHGEEIFESLRSTFEAYSFMAILGAAVTPIPYKIFTIAAGVAQVSLSTLIIASIAGRGARFFAIALVIRLFGPAIKPHLEKYLEMVTIVLFLVGVAGIIVLKWLG